MHVPFTIHNGPNNQVRGGEEVGDHLLPQVEKIENRGWFFEADILDHTEVILKIVDGEGVTQASEGVTLRHGQDTLTEKLEALITKGVELA